MPDVRVVLSPLPGCAVVAVRDERRTVVAISPDASVAEVVAELAEVLSPYEREVVRSTYGWPLSPDLGVALARAWSVTPPGVPPGPVRARVFSYPRSVIRDHP